MAITQSQIIAASLEKVGSLHLKNGLFIYDVGGQTLFPIYGMSGGLLPEYVFYICRMNGKKMQVLPVRVDFDQSYTETIVDDFLRGAMELFEKFSHPVESNGDLGLNGIRFGQKAMSA